MPLVLDVGTHGPPVEGRPDLGKLLDVRRVVRFERLARERVDNVGAIAIELDEADGEELSSEKWDA